MRNTLRDKLVAIVGSENVLDEECDLISYSGDHLPINPLGKFVNKPDFVIRPKTAQHILEIIQLANALKFPVVPRAAGTGMSGGVIPFKGGVLLDMRSMDRIIEIDEKNMTTEVEVGVGLKTLEDELLKRDFLLGHMPCSLPAATVGGAISTSGVGYLCDVYGVMADMILGLEVVLPYGEVIQVGGKYRKSSCGYDLKKLFAGAMGTLGVITKAILRITPLPDFNAMCAMGFLDFPHALDASHKITTRRLRPVFNHVCDVSYIKSWGEAENSLSDMKFLESLAAIVYLRFEGNKDEVIIRKNEALKICKASGGLELNEEFSQTRWNNLTKGFYETTEDSTFWTADIAVPFSKVIEVYNSVKNVIEKYNLKYMGARWASVSNCGFPFSYVFDKRDSNEWDNHAKAEEEIAVIAINAGGTMSDAHGVGNRTYKHLMREELGAALITMSRIKEALDPNNVMNPGIMPPRNIVLDT